MRAAISVPLRARATTSGLPSALAAAAIRNCWPTGGGAGEPASPGDESAKPGDDSAGAGGVCAEWLVPGTNAATAVATSRDGLRAARIRLVLPRRSARTAPPWSSPALPPGMEARRPDLQATARLARRPRGHGPPGGIARPSPWLSEEDHVPGGSATCRTRLVRWPQGACAAATSGCVSGSRPKSGSTRGGASAAGELSSSADMPVAAGRSTAAGGCGL